MSEPTCSLTLDKPSIEQMSRKYCDVVQSLCDLAGWDLDLIAISERALADALGEAAKDLEVMKRRRRPKSISEAKLAGILAFRLVRWAPLHLSGALLEDNKALKINFLAALAFALKHILNVNVASYPPSVTQELQYNLARRHTNQETLGLAFDLMVFKAN